MDSDRQRRFYFCLLDITKLVERAAKGDNIQRESVRITTGETYKDLREWLDKGKKDGAK